MWEIEHIRQLPGDATELARYQDSRRVRICFDKMRTICAFGHTHFARCGLLVMNCLKKAIAKTYQCHVRIRTYFRNVLSGQCVSRHYSV